MSTINAATARAGGKMAIHAITAEVIEASIEAGVDSIEHGNFMEPDLVDGTAKRAIACVPTLIIHDGHSRYFPRPWRPLR
jgi:imidazolonepropionase-like amidohydrolase